MGLSGLVEASPLGGEESWLLFDSSDCREVVLSLVVSLSSGWLSGGLVTARVRAGGLPAMTGSAGGARGPTEEKTAGVAGGAAGMCCLRAVLLLSFL